MKDEGLTIGQLTAGAWLFAVGALVVFFRLLAYQDDPPEDSINQLIWAFVGGVSAVAAAGFAVVTALKASEHRIVHQLNAAAAQSSGDPEQE